MPRKRRKQQLKPVCVCSRSALKLILKGLVVDGVDGDTVSVVIRKGGTPLKVRLYDIDAPQMDQEYGKESKDALTTRVLGKVIFVDIVGVDKFGRQVGILYNGSQRQSFNKELVELGLAYNWPRYGMLYGGNNAQVRARKKRVGIWKHFGGEVRPWSHRHGSDQTPMEYMQAKNEAEALAKIANKQMESEFSARPVPPAQESQAAA